MLLSFIPLFLPRPPTVSRQPGVVLPAPDRAEEGDEPRRGRLLAGPRRRRGVDGVLGAVWVREVRRVGEWALVLADENYYLCPTI